MTEAPDEVHTGELPVISPDDTGGPPRPRRFRRLRLSLKLLLLAAVGYYVLVSVIPGVRKAAHELRTVNSWLLLTGFALEMSALYCYSLLTRAALGDGAKALSTWRLFRIQMSTKALSSIVPGGSAAGSALGYRLMTLSGVPGPDAGFALATAGLGSAIVLNLIFWAGLLISIPVRGVNPGYATAALGGILVMVLAGAVVFGLTEGKGRAERIVRWVARRLKLSEDRAAAGIRQVGGRMEDLAADKPLLARVGVWAAANWLLDIAALWVFLRAFGQPPDLDALIVAFGLVNVAAVIPILPGGLGTIDLGLPAALIGFGMARSHAFLGVGAWRLIQYFFPTVLGGILYLSLRVGPWSITRRERLKRLRDLAAEYDDETSLDFAARFAKRQRALGDQASTFPVEGDGFDDHGDSKGVFPGY